MVELPVSFGMSLNDTSRDRKVSELGVTPNYFTEVMTVCEAYRMM
jgi:hypothetical protein